MPNRNRPLRHLIERGHQLGGLDWIALHHQTNAGAEFDGLRHRRRERQRNERIHAFGVFARQFAALRKRRRAGDRNMRVLRRPYRVEAALLQRSGERAGVHRVVGEKHRRAEFHGRPLPHLSHGERSPIRRRQERDDGDEAMTGVRSDAAAGGDRRAGA